MEPTKELLDAIYRERVLRARQTPWDQKFMAGAELFERCCQIMMDGIRNEQGDLDDQTIRELLDKRLELLRRVRQSQ